MKKSPTPTSNSTIRSRMEILSPLIKGVEVVDLGVVDYRERRRDDYNYLETEPTLLFRQIFDINPNVIGVDINKEGIDNLKTKGFNAICDNVESMLSLIHI